VLSFSLVLCIEKIVTDHHHAHGDEERKIRKTILATINRDRDHSEDLHHDHDSEDHGHGKDHDHEHEHKPRASNLLENPDNATQMSQPMLGKRNIEGGTESDEDEEAFKNVTRTVNRIAKKMSFVQNVKKSVALDRMAFEK
jgi:ABC-type Zn2+ transport system substrate-binding protein/surface adhesin